MAKTILVVEDDSAIQKGLVDNLSREGYRVLSERDGVKGLKTAQEKLPDLVILDVMLPHMTGFDICSRLKQNGFSHPIFLLTGLAEESDRLKGLDFGADDYIPKPFSVKELLLRVRNALGRTEKVLGKAKALDDELKRAREIQLGSLPKEALRVSGLEVYGMTVPATHVGGDYFDYFKIDEDRVAVLIADVSGKGMPAAMYVQKMQGIVQSSRANVHTPKDILNALEEHMGRSMEAASFVTAAAAVLDRQTGRAQFVNAGHLPVYRNRKGKVQELKPEGFWIGQFSAPMFTAQMKVLDIDIKKGDNFLFFTDGANESVNARNREFGMKRVAQLLNSVNGSVEEITGQCLSRVEKFVGSTPQHDDITFVVVRVL